MGDRGGRAGAGAGAADNTCNIKIAASFLGGFIGAGLITHLIKQSGGSPPDPPCPEPREVKETDDGAKPKAKELDVPDHPCEFKKSTEKTDK
ncbi:hypothetical protein JYU34_009950 [Plutella xylostella]|uniref:Uncharacterized protein n=1 Tax=Plutella xylostella TaxID=51655 RepID=A0ABQ7QKQ2_PLUXY|nr:hypothetical protein JYU34_009950 [Plutella xylostella]